MDRKVFRDIKGILRSLGAYRRRPGQVHTDGAIVVAYYFALLNRRSTWWACDRANWLPGLWRGQLPSQSCMSRRLRTPAIRALLDRLEHAVRPALPELVVAAAIDGKPLEIAMHSSDPHAGKGRGAGHTANGYKIHALLSVCGTLICWRLSPLSISERTMACRMMRSLPTSICYIVGDSHYDTNPLAAAARQAGAQLAAPRKRSDVGKGLGHRPHDQARLRSIQMLEPERSPFAADLMRSRTAVERLFAQWSNPSGGLIGLPPWVRTYPRVKAWVQAQLVIAILQGTIPTPRRQCVA